MHGKRRTAASGVTESAAQAALRRGSACELAPGEEKVVRMRLGAALPLSARLERIATATDSEIEILAYEIEAYLRLRERRAATVRAVELRRTAAPVSSSRTKEKIVRALRKKQ